MIIDILCTIGIGLSICFFSLAIISEIVESKPRDKGIFAELAKVKNTISLVIGVVIGVVIDKIANTFIARVIAVGVYKTVDTGYVVVPAIFNFTAIGIDKAFDTADAIATIFDKTLAKICKSNKKK